MEENSSPTDESTAPTLNRTQRRVLGVLVEKAFCTPEYYPLTVKAATTGCNQKSNRDPVVSLAESQVEDVLEELKQMGLAISVFPATGRAERWKHAIKDGWELDRPQRAVLAELFLRGAQTEGELRSRASRMVGIASLEELHAILDQLTARGFVRRLSPPGQKRGVYWTHTVMPAKELESISVPAPEAEASAPRAPMRELDDGSLERLATLEQAIQETQNLVNELKDQVERLNESHERLKRDVGALREELGA